MPNNVYIGSRYVPIFDGEWRSTKNYEGLTIVTYNGSSYTSKGPVPAGTLPTNTTYWALTGNYNGQISNLQQQIDNIEDVTIPAIDARITATNTKISSLDPYEKFRNKTICVIGDSISAYATLANNWVKLLTDFMADYDCTVINKAQDGQSFAGLKVALDNSSFTVPSADYYILFLGLNDWQGSNSWGWNDGSNPVLTAMNTVDSAIKTANRSAKYFFISPMKFFLTNTINNNRTPITAYRAYYEKYFSRRGYTVLSGFNMGEMCSATVGQYTLDNLHPNATYAPIMFEYILDGLVSERSNITPPQIYEKIIANTITNLSNIYEQIDDNYVTLDFDIYNWTPGTNAWVNIMDVPNIIANGSNSVAIFSTLNGVMRVQNGKLQVYFYNAPSSIQYRFRLIFFYGMSQNN